MTLTLTANISADDRYLHVTGTVPDDIEPTYRFRLGDELLELQAFVTRIREVGRAGTIVDRNSWYVLRGLDTSSGASHTAGTEIKGATDAYVAATSGPTPPNPFAAGGGSGIPQGGPLTEDLDADGNTITNLAPGVASTDAATVGQLGGGEQLPDFTAEADASIGLTAGPKDDTAAGDVVLTSGADAGGEGSPGVVTIEGAADKASAEADGGNILVVGGATADGDQFYSGNVKLTGGASVGDLGEGGYVQLEGGIVADRGTGAIVIAFGGVSDNGGQAGLYGGSGAAESEGGEVEIIAGSSAGGTGGQVHIRGGDGGSGTSGPAYIESGAVTNTPTAYVSADGSAANVATGALVDIHTGNSSGVAGQAVVSNGSGQSLWGGVISAAGVPSGAPDGKLPFAYDTTAVTGGFYFWNGAAWVKVATIL